MKKILFVVLGLFLMFCLCALNFLKADGITVGDNLFNDPSFEEYGVDLYQNVRNKSEHWTQVSWCNVDKGLGYARTGANQAFMTFAYETLNVGEYPTLYQDVDVKRDTYYEFSFYVRRFGEAESVPLYVGIRDIYNHDPWENIDQTIVTDVTSTEYVKVSTIFYSGDYTELRFAIYICSIAYPGEMGGYHLDDMALYEISPLKNATIEIDPDITIGKPIEYVAKVELENGNIISSSDTSSIKTAFTSSDENIICCDLSGNAVALSEGTCNLNAYVTFCGKKMEASSQEVTINSSAIPDKPYIKSVNLNMPDPLILTDYSEIYYSFVRSDGGIVDLENLSLNVESSDPSVAFIELAGSKIQAIGVGKGVAKLYVTATFNEMVCIASLKVEVKDNNYLKDPSFECYEKNRMWTVEANCGCGIDSGLLNGLSHNGYSNFWMMAPIYWDASCVNTSRVLIHQMVYLLPGEYELSAYINRFYATGVDGTLPGVGGNVKIGAVQLDENNHETENDQHSEFDVSYGFGGYQRLSTLIKVEEAGNYKIYYRVDGDEDFGLGMQLDDMYLVDAIYPVSIKAYLLDDNFGIDDLAQVIVEATYEDGSIGFISSGIRIIPDDYHIAYESGGFLIGRNNGTTKIKIKAEILKRPYETSFEVKVGTGISDSDAKPVKKGCKKGAIIVLGFTLSLTTLVFFLRRRDR